MQTAPHEKGKQVFIDNVDVFLTDRIIKHTNTNADKGPLGEKASESIAHNSIESNTVMKKHESILFKALPFLVLAIIGIGVFFLCRQKFCLCKKK
jgi:hypothetical protein